MRTCAVGTRMTTRAERKVFSCSKKCGRTFPRKSTQTRHSRTCKGPKTCPYCNYPYTYGSNIIGSVLWNLYTTYHSLKGQNWLHEKAPRGKTPKTTNNVLSKEKTCDPKEIHNHKEKTNPKVWQKEEEGEVGESDTWGTNTRKWNEKAADGKDTRRMDHHWYAILFCIL